MCALLVCKESFVIFLTYILLQPVTITFSLTHNPVQILQTISTQLILITCISHKQASHEKKPSKTLYD